MLLQVLGRNLKGANLIQSLQALLHILVWRGQEEPQAEWEGGREGRIHLDVNVSKINRYNNWAEEIIKLLNHHSVLKTKERLCVIQLSCLGPIKKGQTVLMQNTGKNGRCPYASFSKLTLCRAAKIRGLID